MKQGVVKWFDDAKGFGFISRDKGDDVLVHYAALKSNGFRSLQEGQLVTFNVVKGPKGWMAEDVQYDLRAAAPRKNNSPVAQLQKASKTSRRLRAAKTVTNVKNSEALVSGIWKALQRPGIKREAIFLRQSPRKVYAYSVLPSDPTKIVREAADGSRTVGRLQSGVFREIKAKKA